MFHFQLRLRRWGMIHGTTFQIPSHSRQGFHIASLSRFSGGLFGFSGVHAADYSYEPPSHVYATRANHIVDVAAVHVAKIGNGITHISFNIGCQRFGKAKRHAWIRLARIDGEVVIVLDFSDVLDVEHCSFMLVGDVSFTPHLKAKERERLRMQMLQLRQALLAETQTSPP